MPSDTEMVEQWLADLRAFGECLRRLRQDSKLYELLFDTYNEIGKEGFYSQLENSWMEHKEIPIMGGPDGEDVGKSIARYERLSEVYILDDFNKLRLGKKIVMPKSVNFNRILNTLFPEDIRKDKNYSKEYRNLG